MNRARWIVQGLLALLFLFGGVVKLIMPIEELVSQIDVPGPFIRFIAVCELLGALGLILPGLLRIRPGLTPLAAAGLVIITSGATAPGLASGDAVAMMFPLVGIFSAFVAYGRWWLAPLGRPGRQTMPSSAG
jgi:hypothetical protein